MNYPDEETAKITVQRFEENNGSLSSRRKDTLYTLSSYSRFLGNACLNNPSVLDYLSKEKQLGEKKQLKDYTIETAKIISGCEDENEMMRKLRKYKYRELARTIFRDITGKSDNFVDVMEELSDLASATVESVYRFYASELFPEQDCSFVILGMGKLGGRLLNLSSDIDLIYIFRDDDGDKPYYKLGEKITKSISSITDNGFLYRVDLRLRPGGGKSPISVSYEGAVEHYFYWGDTWERAALINARPVAGKTKIGDEFLDEITPFVYSRSLDYESIQDLKDMKTKLDRLKKEMDVKLGRGGIREIEFFINAMQLVNGGAFPELRWQNTVSALNTLKELELIEEETATTLKESYLFLRKVEHNIQLADEIQTHKVPRDEKALLALSKKLGFEDIPSFTEKYSEATCNVSGIYEKLFYDPSRRVEEEGREFWELADYLTEGNIPEEDAIETLREKGFKQPGAALDVISILIDPKRGALTQKGRILTRKVIPAFLSNIIKSHNPDAALRNLEKFITSAGWRTSIYAVMAENPEILKLLAKLFSTSGVLSNFLTRHPEYLDILTLKNARIEFYDKEQMIEELATSVDNEKEYEDKLDVLRRFKNVETLKVCLRDLNQEIDPVYVGKYLSMLGKAVLEVGLRIAIEVTAKTKAERNVLENIVILGMGKFGGQEMSYNSDLDLIFIYEGDNHEKFSKLGQRVISILSTPTGEGYCYKIDLDLRPSGRSGALVTSFDSFKDYHETSAKLWERQSLIRSVPAAGNMKLGKKVMKTIEEFVYEKPLDEEFHKQIDELRMRMENELAKESKSKLNLKTGRGGLVDIEFLVQMMQLRYGSEYGNVRCQNTIEALNRLRSEGLISDADHETLHEAYLFLKKMENLLRLLHDRSISKLHESDFDHLSLEMEGYSSSADLKRRYSDITEKVRSVYDKYFAFTEKQ